MAKKIMIQGTMSGVGKSFLAAGLCRIFREDGFRVSPFKSQNMALNSFVTAEGLEMGRAQVMQAEAAGTEADVRMNPVLLKPTGDRGSQVIVMGEVYADLSAKDYFREKKKLIPVIEDAFHSLEAENDIIVLEGAGSPVEININKDDIVNFGIAELFSSPVLLASDIDRGGVFAQLSGTVSLLKEDERRFLKGLIINKFRGDPSILGSGVAMIEELTSVPVLGIVPFTDIRLDDEDSLSDSLSGKASGGLLDIAVIRLQRISNFTDFRAFELVPEVGLRYVGSMSELGIPDMLIIPGSKNSLSDLRWLQKTGLWNGIKSYVKNGGIVFGICGGLQILGETLSDPCGNEGGGSERGLSLLDINTVFSGEKVRKQVSGVLEGLGGVFSDLNGAGFEGYEIHMGVSEELTGRAVISKGNVYGTYVHGIFDRKEISETIIKALLERRGFPKETFGGSAFDMKEYKEREYRLLSETLRKSLDMDRIYRIMDEGV